MVLLLLHQLLYFYFGETEREKGTGCRELKDENAEEAREEQEGGNVECGKAGWENFGKFVENECVKPDC